MFLQITHANGQTSEVEVGEGYTLAVVDSNARFAAVFAFSSVTGFAISPTSLYAAEVPAEEEPVEVVEAVAAEDEFVEDVPDEPEDEPVSDVEPDPEPVVEPDVPAEEEPVAKPRRSFGKK